MVCPLKLWCVDQNLPCSHETDKQPQLRGRRCSVRQYLQRYVAELLAVFGFGTVTHVGNKSWAGVKEVWRSVPYELVQVR